MAEADGEGIGDAVGGDGGSPSACGAERARALFGEGRHGNAELDGALIPGGHGTWPNRQPFLDVDDGRVLAQAIVDTIREPLLVLDKDLRVVAASRSFYLTFKLDVQDVEGRPVYALGDGQWNIPELRVLLEKILPRHTVMEAYEVEQEFSRIGRRTMLLNAREVFKQRNDRKLILVAIEDVTERRTAERKTAELLQQKDILLREMQHRVANSLQIIASILLLKARTVQSEETRLHLQDAHRRVMSVAAVQQQLQASEPWRDDRARPVSVPAVRGPGGLDDRRPSADLLDGACRRRHRFLQPRRQHGSDRNGARHQRAQACIPRLTGGRALWS